MQDTKVSLPAARLARLLCNRKSDPNQELSEAEWNALELQEKEWWLNQAEAVLDRYMLRPSLDNNQEDEGLYEMVLSYSNWPNPITRSQMRELVAAIRRRYAACFPVFHDRHRGEGSGSRIRRWKECGGQIRRSGSAMQCERCGHTVVISAETRLPDQADHQQTCAR